MIGNLALTLARAVAGAAERRWKDHRRGCPRCSLAVHQRRPDDMCHAGALAYSDHKLSQADLREQNRLAKLPNPDQGALFDREDVH